ncbi:hypothetical protein O6H91_19G001400 [Diphasiastrum complanatum]|uniref:Uncharacterized protein n=2 Tax=Diphasiastrum complanatum TaxID=34168 RepID=A0ACC2AS19_DIPCM|nr:hypothetical protein O6H91_Y400300 [Diphasiastrum complanatum]KAJ7520332.1 hypothetical protein O6H91_19G001400 [Diphasiastrum complanatum]
MSQVAGAASGKSAGDSMRSGFGANSKSLVQTENIRPAQSKNLAPANVMRQTRAASKRAAMDDASRTTSTAPNPHAKKRPALASLSNNVNVPVAHVRPSMSKTTAENNTTAIKNKARTSAQARDVETQMAGLSVVQQKGAASQIKPEVVDNPHDSNVMVVDNYENVPLEAAALPQPGKQSWDENLATASNSLSPVSNKFPQQPTALQTLKQSRDENLATASNSVPPVSNKLPQQPTAVQVLFSANLHWPINQVFLLGNKSPSECSFTNIDVHKDPQMCSMYATDIYQHLRIAELKRRPVTNFMEVIQHEINASMRGILVDWLVEVAEEYKLVPDTLYLTISYIDRFLSTNSVNRQRLQLLGVSCMLIAAKYEEICAPQVEEFCYITDNTYSREEVLEMERRVLNNLHFELTTPTTKTFLRRFIRAAQTAYKIASLQLEFLGNYLTELTLVEYNFLQYLPSMVAASAVFLAKLTLDKDTLPWNITLQHYTGYRPSELKECVKALFDLQCNTKNCTLPAIREKYRQHKFKCVANLKPSTSLPSEYFLDLGI